MNWTAQQILVREELSLGVPCRLHGHTVIDTPDGKRLHFVVYEQIADRTVKVMRMAIYQDGRDSGHCSLIADDVVGS